MKGINTIEMKRFAFGCFAFLFALSMLSAQHMVSGKLTTPTGIPIPGFAISASGTESKIVYTDNNGDYQFSLAPGSYVIAPLDCSEGVLNGLNTFDEVLIVKHMAQEELLNSPYKIIAADINGDHMIDAPDTSLYRKLILAIILDIPAGNYQYVLKNYTFPDPSNPFDPLFPSAFNIADLQNDISGVDFYAIKTGDVNNSAVMPNGCASPDLPSQISGIIFRDQNLNCEQDNGESGLSGWIVTASDGVNSFYGSAGNNGEYNVNVLPGAYTVVLTQPNGLWQGCNDTVPAVVAPMNGVGSQNFGVQPQSDCPSMNVDLSLWSLRRCMGNHYVVNYCNSGTSTAENARVEVDLDPMFVFENASVPFSYLGGNTYSFEIGDVPSGTCGSFGFNFFLSCEATLGQTHCSVARIYPDTVCSQPEASWTGPDLTVSGVCDGDNVRFTVKNQGGKMDVPMNYIVVEDIVVMTPPFPQNFQLGADESMEVSVPANGTTIRLEVDQPPGHPFSNKASATVEGCGVNGNGGFSTGMVNKFPVYNNSPYTDTDCHQNTGSFDPNDKQGLPYGVNNEHFVPNNQAIDYLIRFQNTGTDTAFTVVVRDTLDKHFDVSSFRFLGSSHPLAYNISGEGILHFVFTNIMLPDSNANEPGSHGYIKFSVSPKKGTPNGTIVHNQASIYFDFNNSVVTNTTWHTFGEHYLGTNNHPGFPEMIEMELYPNPVSDNLHVLLKSPGVLEGNFYMYDLLGKLLKVQHFNQNNFIVNTSGLTAGSYFYKVHSKSQLLSTGRFVKTSID